MKGRKALPTEQKRLNGNPGKRPLNKREPRPSQALSIEPPAGLDAAERRIWRDVVAAQAPGVYTTADTDTVIAYVDAVAMLFRARKELRKSTKDGNGLTVETERGWVRNPLTTIIKECRDQIRHLGSELGRTPASRTRLEVPDGGDQKDPWAEIAGFDGRTQTPARC